MQLQEAQSVAAAIDAQNAKDAESLYLKNDKRICVFEFNNGTFIRVAVRFLNPDGSIGQPNKSFERMFAEAKAMSWRGDEAQGRGGLKSFTIGDVIHA